MTQLVNSLPAMQETWVWSLGWEDPLETGMAPHSSILAWRIPWGCKKSDMTKRLSLLRVRWHLALWGLMAYCFLFPDLSHLCVLQTHYISFSVSWHKYNSPHFVFLIYIVKHKQNLKYLIYVYVLCMHMHVVYLKEFEGLTEILVIIIIFSFSLRS